ncbi:hypothetical protein H1Z61_16925 [Bacillus aquiflavi]|uniref:Uncharacterized protein n=1 Tax=Bacillus aquiflavi TaxID=2672567 RepID=A0A6B3W2Z2_9BACI|nr:hypothetical protein [Bacillus aquiflavi]MBA4538763.1 hypothetical protein [Bacillus aquiflavi]NEY83115.1 hypothetical protein [Bacillus aquiflavi]UAC48645.1 hypothetical protein K6959_01215 [Bacillus aquiflavi]
MRQYEMYFTNEYLLEIMDDISTIMKIDYDREKLLKSYESENIGNIDNLFVARDANNPEYFICVDCDNKDWIYPLVVRCSEKQQDCVNKCMLQWDNNIREEYGQELTERINNSFGNGNKDTLLKRIELKYDVKI